MVMKAMVLQQIGGPLRLTEREIPECKPEQVLIKVNACAVCRTDLHIIDGELYEAKLPLVPGHEIVGEVVATGTAVRDLVVGGRVGVPWLGSTCGDCGYCNRRQENLCDNARFTGYHLDGGYAEYTVADRRFVFPLPDTMDDAGLAPLLCAGLIGYRSLRMAGDARQLGIFGFGAAAHIVSQVALYEGRKIYAFTRVGDRQSQDFARALGAVWAGASIDSCPVQLDAAIIYAPAGELVPVALRNVRKGGKVICAGIHMSEIPAFPYRILWGERTVQSVANLTRQDGKEFLRLASRIPIRTTIVPFPLQEANTALEQLRQGQLQGAAVLVMKQSS